MVTALPEVCDSSLAQVTMSTSPGFWSSRESCMGQAPGHKLEEGMLAAPHSALPPVHHEGQAQKMDCQPAALLGHQTSY